MKGTWVRGIVFLLALAATPAAALIEGSSTASNCGEGGNWIDLTFTSDEGVTLVDAWWDFNGTSVWLDADGTSVCTPQNLGVTGYSFYFDVPAGTDTQDFGLTATGFDSGDYFRFTMDLDLGATGMPYGADLMGGTLTVEFSDATVLTAVFDTPYDGTNGATALFDDLADLEFAPKPGWAAPLVPRDAADADWNSVPAPTLLVGESAATWLNAACFNAGGSLAGASHMTLHLDGQLLTTRNLWTIAPGAYNGSTNVGPYTVPGGRHILRVTADAWGEVTESDETDNVLSAQYCWRPGALAPLATQTRAAPPYFDLDFEFGGGGSWYNCDGVRVTPSASDAWCAVWAERLVDDGSDTYPLRLHPASDDPVNAFGTNFEITRCENGLQALLMNTQNFAGPWDVGVLNWFVDGTEDYRIAHLHESPYPFDFGVEPETPYTGQRLLMFAFQVDAGDLGPATLTLYGDPDDGPVHMGWLPPGFAHGNLENLQDVVTTDPAGLARIDLDLDTVGEHCAVVYCDRKDHVGAMAVNVGLYKPRPDLTPATLTGWCAPVVPQPHDASALFDCPLPDTLHGGEEATWMNMAARNAGLAAADTVSFLLGFDGDFNLGLRQFTSLAPGSARTVRNLELAGAPWYVRGGRHTLSVTMDYLDDLDESVERNNATARQYCWSPLALTPDAGISFLGPDIPPSRDGGLDLVDGGAAAYPNCDGLRLPYVAPVGGDGWWRAAAIMPRTAGVDLALRVHPALAGTQDGFGPVVLAESDAGPGLIDFALVRDRFADPADLDVGVLDDVDTPAGGYHAQDARSRWRGSVKSAAVSATMAAGRMIDLHEFQLSPGTWLFTLTDEGGGVDWGMSLYAGGYVHARDDVVDGGLAWEEPAGASERLLVTVPTRDYYCLAVWKTGVAERDKDGPYTLWTAFDVSGVGEPVPGAVAATRLVDAAPNPCNPRTTLHYELAQDGPCRLALYDVQGRLVRTLVQGHRAAGPQWEVWDGLDDGGRRAASGVYLARLTAGRVTDLLKVTLVK